MQTLPDQKVKELIKQAVSANIGSDSYYTILMKPAIDSSGADAIEVIIVLTPGSSDRVIGPPSTNATSEVIRLLADAGEERFPIVRWDTKSESEVKEDAST